MREGFDLFNLPAERTSCGLTSNASSTSSLQVSRAPRRGGGVDAWQFCALAANLLTAKLGLPSTPLSGAADGAAQFLARQIHQRALPDHVPPFCGFRYDDADIARAVTIDYPIFVKPVKAAFSVLAKRCADEAALREHLRFRLWEKIIIKRLTWPFRRVSKTSRLRDRC